MVLAGAALIVCAAPLTAATITVPPGGDLQSALSGAQPGDTILLTPGGVYRGALTLPAKSTDSGLFITVRTSEGANQPGDGQRITPGSAASLAKIVAPPGDVAIRTATGAHHWRLQLLEVLSETDGADLIALGDGSGAQSSLAGVPHDLVLDRVYVHGSAAHEQKRGIALNSAATTITGSYISEIKAAGQDSQAICGWNGPGPFLITNNYLEGAGENVLFGGSDPAVPNLVPTDITIAGNTISKPVEWRRAGWSVKNLVELKNARNVEIDGNTIEYNWQGGQSGFAVLFTVRNQNGACPWCQVEQVVFENNVVRHSAAAISILGVDDVHPSRQTQTIFIRNNLFADIDSRNWGGNGYFLQLAGGPRGIVVDHNTIIQDHADGLVQIDGPPVQQFSFTNNLARHNTYGIIGTSRGVGNDTIRAYLPVSMITHNVLAGGSASQYPVGNSFPATADFEAQFVAYSQGDYALVAGSSWRRGGTDSLDLGAALGPSGARPIPGPVSRPRMPIVRPGGGGSMEKQL